MSTERFELIAPCHFGLEAVLKREILDLGYEISNVEDGKVTFLADAQGIADANVFLRTTERILLKIAEVKAETFDELFEATKALPWERYIPADSLEKEEGAKWLKDCRIWMYRGAWAEWETPEIRSSARACRSQPRRA